MVSVAITEEGVASGKIAAEHLEVAVGAIRREGFVVLERVVDLGHLDVLRAKMLEDITELVGREDAPFNWNKGNLQQDPPPFHPYLFRDVLLNDIVVAVTRSLLGKGVKNSLYTGNTALPERTNSRVIGPVPRASLRRSSAAGPEDGSPIAARARSSALARRSCPKGLRR